MRTLANACVRTSAIPASPPGASGTWIWRAEPFWADRVKRLDDANDLVVLLERRTENRARREPGPVVDTPEPPWVLCNVVAHHSLARLRHPPTNALPESDEIHLLALGRA